MASNVVYPPQGVPKDAIVPAGESIVVYTKDIAHMYPKMIDKDWPDTLNPIGPVINDEVVFGPYPEGIIIKLYVGKTPILYQIGTAPVITEHKGLRVQKEVSVITEAKVLTAEMLLSGIIVTDLILDINDNDGDGDGNINVTLDTGDALDVVSEFTISDSFDWSIINTGDNTKTFTLVASSGHTIIGNVEVFTETSAAFRTQKTLDNTFITYRIS